MRISDWSSDVCSSDLMEVQIAALRRQARAAERYRTLSDQISIAEARLVHDSWREAAQAAETARAEAGQAEALVDPAGKAQEEAANRQELVSRGGPEGDREGKGGSRRFDSGGLRLTQTKNQKQR